MLTIQSPRGNACAIGFDEQGVWTRSGEELTRPTSILLIAAHPDDEVIGAGSKLVVLPNLTIVHTTNGSPKNMNDARLHGFESVREYGLARRLELSRALETLRAKPVEMKELGFSDQESALRLPDLTLALIRLIEESSPDIILTHPYEGGHPDHDACAFGVHAAALLLGRSSIFEFACYHAADSHIRTAEFLESDSPVTRLCISSAEQDLKRRALACFDTQRETLSLFRTDIESYRPAPAYDFSSPPHSGQLYYERFDWGMTGKEFRAMVSRTACELGIKESVF